MRPLFTLPHTVGLLMLGYAVGVLATPASGVMNWLDTYTFLTPPMMAAMFAGCGVYILIASPRPALFSLLTLPLLMYGFAAVLFFASNPNGALTAIVAHNGLWFVIQAALIDQARRGPSLPFPEGEPWNQ